MQQRPTVSVIVAIYSDLRALALIIDSLLAQTLIPDEVIIAEDAQHADIKAYIEQLGNDRIIHISQEDNGWQKERALNSAVKAATSEYLIFIDGDCVPYTNFVEGHVTLSQPNTALCGRRTEPGELFSQKLRESELSVEAFQKSYLKNYPAMSKDGIRHYDEGLYF